MSSIDPRDFGLLEGQVEALRTEFKTHKDESQRAMSEANRKMDELLAMANRSKGALWMGLGLAGVLGAMVEFIVSHIWRN